MFLSFSLVVYYNNQKIFLFLEDIHPVWAKG